MDDQDGNERARMAQTAKPPGGEPGDLSMVGSRANQAGQPVPTIHKEPRRLTAAALVEQQWPAVVLLGLGDSRRVAIRSVLLDAARWIVNSHPQRRLSRMEFFTTWLDGYMVAAVGARLWYMAKGEAKANRLAANAAALAGKQQAWGTGTRPD